MMNTVQEHARQAHLWIDDVFIRQGLENILADIEYKDKNVRLVFFTIKLLQHCKKTKL